MALSLFRNASTKLTGCPGKLMVSNLKRFTTVSVTKFNDKLSAETQRQLLCNKSIGNNSLLKNNYTSLTASISAANLNVPVRTMSSGDHSTTWKIERLLATSMLFSLPLTVMYPSPYLDSIFALSIVMHQYWGLEAICRDYLRAIIFGNFIAKASLVSVVLLAFATLGGMFYFIYNDIGIGNAIRKFWALQGK